MKKYITVLCLLILASGCKEDASSESPTVNEVQRMSCNINGIAFQNAGGIQNLSFSYQSGSIPSYSIIGKNGDRQIRLYVQAAMEGTGAFETPTLAKVIYGDSLGDYYPSQDSGLITITRNDAHALAGKFHAVHTFQNYTRTFTNGEFYIKK